MARSLEFYYSQAMTTTRSIGRRIGAMVSAALFVSTLASALPGKTAFAHSGGTDKYGCHAGSRPYHCHNSLSATERLELERSFKREYLRNGLTVKGGFAYSNKRYKSCAALNRDLFRGVSKSRLAMESLYTYTGTLYALVSPALYKKNVHLDADKDGVACGLLEPENQRVPTFLCNPGSQEGLNGLTPETAFRCVIDSKQTGGWLIEIVSVSPNATDAVLAEEDMNDEPYPGNQYFIVTIKVTNLTGKTAFFSRSTIKALGNSGNVYDYRNRCGYINPNEFNGLDMRNGETRIGNVCWEVSSSDADDLKIFYDNYFQRTYLSYK